VVNTNDSRPKTIGDIAYQEEVVKTLQKALETGNLPHLLFYGPPGTGKTSTILAMARQLFGPEMYKARVMELNASDERGIDVIRTKIKTFAQLAAGGKAEGYPCPPFKIIILDEADSMTDDAQAALRRVIEMYTHVTRFCLLCNYVSRIIDPVASRCAKFRFRPLEGATMMNRLKYISEQEGVTINAEGLETLIALSGGDLRKAITFLQSMHTISDSEITKETIIEVTGIIPVEKVKEVFEVCRLKSFLRVQTAVTELAMEGYSAQQFVAQMSDVLVHDATLSSADKSQIAMRLAQTDARLNDGADEFLQLLDLCGYIMSVFAKTS